MQGIARDMKSHPTILIAVDVEEGAGRAAVAARALFGSDATYRFAHVAQPVPLTPPLAATATPLSTAYPVGVAPVDPDTEQAATRHGAVSSDETIDSARAVAARAAADAGLESAESVGLIGHPADAIIDEATACGADAIVVTPHHHGWIDRLFHQSVSDEIQKTSSIPVLVVPTPE